MTTPAGHRRALPTSRVPTPRRNPQKKTVNQVPGYLVADEVDALTRARSARLSSFRSIRYCTTLKLARCSPALLGWSRHLVLR